MIHQLSRSTTYLQTYVVHPQTGEHKLRSHATGFFIRASDALLLVTNWHVVTGLDPSAPSAMKEGNHPPHFIKATVAGKNGWLTELSMPLYNRSMQPLWGEHPLGGKVDIAIYPLPAELEDHFHFVDVHSVEDDTPIEEMIAKDVFILGYPFSRADMTGVFGEEAPYYIPVWKRGSIATEPALRLDGRVLLIDSLSRPGMSGAPVFIAQDTKLMGAGNAANSKAFERLLTRDNSAFREIDTTALTDVTTKHFRFMGLYSGTIGSTRLSEVALGKCWHVDTLLDLIANACEGKMPFHAPMPNVHYEAFLAETAGGQLVRKNVNGEVTERIALHKQHSGQSVLFSGWKVSL